jgi:drug/metabolite transporter (DMT)-like permease
MYSVLARKYKVDPVQATIAFTVFAVLCFVPLYGLLAYAHALPFGLVSHLADAPRNEIAMQMLLQGVGSGIVGNIGFTMMLKTFGPVKTTMMTALVPSLAALSAVFFLGEPLYWNLIAGLILALTGVTLGVFSSASTAKVPPERGDVSKADRGEGGNSADQLISNATDFPPRFASASRSGGTESA